MLNIAMLSYHTCPLAVLGGKDKGRGDACAN